MHFVILIVLQIYEYENIVANFREGYYKYLQPFKFNSYNTLNINILQSLRIIKGANPTKPPKMI